MRSTRCPLLQHTPPPPPPTLCSEYRYARQVQVRALRCCRQINGCVKGDDPQLMCSCLTPLPLVAGPGCCFPGGLLRFFRRNSARLYSALHLCRCMLHPAWVLHRRLTARNGEFESDLSVRSCDFNKTGFTCTRFFLLMDEWWRRIKRRSFRDSMLPTSSSRTVRLKNGQFV